MAGNLPLSREEKEKEKLVLVVQIEASLPENLPRTMASFWVALEVKLIEIVKRGTTIVGQEAKLTAAI